HLAQAGRRDELSELLADYRWIAARLAATDPSTLIRGYELVSGDADLENVRKALALSIDALARDPTQLANQLVGRLGGAPAGRVSALLERASQPGAAPALRLRSATLVPPGGALLRSITGGRGKFNAMAVSDDGRRAVTA